MLLRGIASINLTGSAPAMRQIKNDSEVIVGDRYPIKTQCREHLRTSYNIMMAPDATH